MNKQEAHVYFPASVFSDLKLMAQLNRRSLSAEIVIAVEERINRENFRRQCELVVSLHPNPKNAGAKTMNDEKQQRLTRAREIGEKIADELLSQNLIARRTLVVDRVAEILSAELARDWNVIAEVGLPEKPDLYFVTTNAGSVQCAAYQPGLHESDWTVVCHGALREVKAWCECPPAYRPQIQENADAG